MAEYDKRTPQLGQIKRIFANPCQVPVHVYVETGAISLMKAFFDILSPDPKELYHDIRGHSALCDFKSILKDIPGVPPEEESAATRFLFKSLEWYDLATWWLFLAGVAADGLADWTSQLIKLQKCSAPSSPHYGYGDAFFGGLPENGDWNTADFSMNSGSKFAPVHYSGLVVPPGKKWSISANATWTAVKAGATLQVQCRLRNNTGGYDLDFYEVASATPTSHSTMVWSEGRNNTDADQHINVEWACAPVGPSLATGAVINGGSCFLYLQP
jgi:hypothetical protein